MRALLVALALLAAAPLRAEEPAPAPPTEPPAEAQPAEPAPPPPPPGRPLAQLFAAPPSPPPPAPPPEPGKPPAPGPAADWSVEVGPYPSRAQAERRAEALAAHWPDVEVTEWADAAGDAWFTATLARRTPWQALQAVRALAGQGVVSVRAMPPPPPPPPPAPAP